MSSQGDFNKKEKKTQDWICIFVSQRRLVVFYLQGKKKQKIKKWLAVFFITPLCQGPKLAATSGMEGGFAHSRCVLIS